MLLMLLFQNPIGFFIVFGTLVISLTIHEYAHAYASHKLGDDTAMYLGRLSLNPKVHLDPLGTIFLLVGGFGWGKPVPVNPYNFSNPKRDHALVSIAGPASNFILAVLLAIIYNVISIPFLNSILALIIMFNIILGLFNLIPIHPLDGFKVVGGLLPDHLSIQWNQMAPYGIYILLLLIFTNTTGLIVGPILNLVMGVLGVRYPGLQ